MIHERRQPARLPRPTRIGYALLFIVAIVLGIATALATSRAATAEPEELTPEQVRALIVERAAAHGTDPAPLFRVAWCETRFRPSARGDWRGETPTSHGLYQLNDLEGTGLLWHFYAVGYTDAYDAEQAADYTARVAAGEFASDGVTLARWSCYR